MDMSEIGGRRLRDLSALIGLVAALAACGGGSSVESVGLDGARPAAPVPTSPPPAPSATAPAPSATATAPAPSATPPAAPPTAPPSVPSLRLDAYAWVDLMPRVIFPGESPSCTKMFVRFDVKTAAPALPPALRATRLTVQQLGKPMVELPISASETGYIDDATFSGIGRACQTQDVTIDVPTIIRLDLANGDRSAQLELTSVLRAAY